MSPNLPARMRRALITGAAFTLLSFAGIRGAHAQNQTAPPSRAEMIELLSGVEHEPALATVRAWGPPASRLLMELASDTTTLPHARVRAVHALRAFASADVHSFLRVFAATADHDVFLERAAFDALIEGFDDVADVARYLRDPSVDVRDGAAWALSQSRSAGARTALTAALRTESDPTVRQTITAALQRRP